MKSTYLGLVLGLIAAFVEGYNPSSNPPARELQEERDWRQPSNVPGDDSLLEAAARRSRRRAPIELVPEGRMASFQPQQESTPSTGKMVAYSFHDGGDISSQPSGGSGENGQHGKGDAENYSKLDPVCMTAKSLIYQDKARAIQECTRMQVADRFASLSQVRDTRQSQDASYASASLRPGRGPRYRSRRNVPVPPTYQALVPNDEGESVQP